jgi:hypothetical protein
MTCLRFREVMNNNDKLRLIRILYLLKSSVSFLYSSYLCVYRYAYFIIKVARLTLGL